MFGFQSAATWTAVLTGLASPATARATRAGTATCATSRPATTGARLTGRAPTEPACAQTVRNTVLKPFHFRKFEAEKKNELKTFCIKICKCLNKVK